MVRELRRLAAIVSTDVVAYSRLMGRDESGTLAGLKSHLRDLVDPKISEYGGRTVKSMGDELLLEFPSVVDAVRCAVDIQRGMAERNAGTPEAEQIRFRIGINVGDIIIDGDDIFGDGVNVAARLQALADPGGICVSRAVRDQVLDKLNFAFVDLGSHHVKNITRPLDVYRIELESQGTAEAVRAPGGYATRSARRPFRLMLLAMAAVAVIGVGFAAWIANQFSSSPVAVTPYSIQDRRMTFAVLPFQAPADDPTGTRIAQRMTEAALAALEQFTDGGVQVASASSAAQAFARHVGTRDLASDLKVHFLVRGRVLSEMPGYTLDLLLVDGASERVIAPRQLPIGAGGRGGRERDALVLAIFPFTEIARGVEVQRARETPLDALDVRDLAFRAWVDWNRLRQNDGSAAYASAMDLLRRALAISPNDPYALNVMARINLCDCMSEWSGNVDEQMAIGAAALEKYLAHDPFSRTMLRYKADLYALRGKYEESLLIVDSVLKREPNHTPALAERAYYLLKLGRPREALIAITDAQKRREVWPDRAKAAAIHYALADYARAAESAQGTRTQMSQQALRDRYSGTVVLILVAAEARQGHLSRAHSALADFKAAVPGVDTITAIKKWMHPTADLAGFEPLFDGLRLAGVPD